MSIKDEECRKLSFILVIIFFYTFPFFSVYKNKQFVYIVFVVKTGFHPLFYKHVLLITIISFYIYLYNIIINK